jgi:hypothetical protein
MRGRLNCHVIGGEILPFHFNSEASEAPSFHGLHLTSQCNCVCQRPRPHHHALACATLTLQATVSSLVTVNEGATSLFVRRSVILRVLVDLEEAAIFVFVCPCL